MTERLLRVLRKNGFRRGIRGGHPLWVVLGASAWMVSRARRRDDSVIYRTLLVPGERLTVTARHPGGVELPGD
ncbi:MAG: hypothetical protein ACYCV7_02900 [Acidimicrobiales bacterium]